MPALPINVDELLNGQIVEWERLEFKQGWNPEEVIHSLCAFANDINNWGGGYIIIGIEEKDGQPLLPPKGVTKNKIDGIQKEIIQLGHRLRPNYHPITVPLVFQNKTILILWCPGGPTRPYQAPETLGKKPNYFYFIRRNSSTVHAREKDMPRLYELASQLPFDDRVCHQGELEDLNLSLIKDFLREVKSDLYSESSNLSFQQLCRQMQIVQGPDEYLKPLNIGILMFNEDPDRFFPCARIEVVEFHDEVGDSFSEKIFKGPIHLQLREALRYIQSMYLREEVRKRPDRAEADRFYNYPYIALEESLANAVYHKDYAKREPIEIRIHPDRIEIISFPGPLPPLKMEDLNKGPVRIRNYRNRRIGDFLKELHLTEGRCTGIPKVRKAMKNNGSPPAIFETDEDASYFLTILPSHSALQPKIDQLEPKEGSSALESIQSGSESTQSELESTQSDLKSIQLIRGKCPVQLLKRLDTLGNRPSKKQLWDMIQELCTLHPLTAGELCLLLGRGSKKAFVRDHLTPMVKQHLLAYTSLGGLHSSLQAYQAVDRSTGVSGEIQ